MKTDSGRKEKLTHPYRILPPGYYQSGSFCEWLVPWGKFFKNFLGVLLAIIFGLLFFALLKMIRLGVEFFNLIFNTRHENSVLVQFAIFTTSIGLMFGLHEGFHNLFFRLFTNEKRKNRLEQTDQYDPLYCWFFPRPHYTVIRLSPLVLISLLSIILIIFLPMELLLFPWLMAVTNGVYSVLDIIEVVVMTVQPTNCLVEDRGDTLFWYLPVK